MFIQGGWCVVTGVCCLVCFHDFSAYYIAYWWGLGFDYYVILFCCSCIMLFCYFVTLILVFIILDHYSLIVVLCSFL